MVHPVTAVGAESDDDGIRPALGLCRSAPGMRSRHRLRPFNLSAIHAVAVWAIIVAPVAVSIPITVSITVPIVPVAAAAHGSACSDGFDDRGTGTTSESAEGFSGRALRVMHVVTAGTAGAASHAALVAERTVGAHRSAIQPGFVEVFTGLHVKTDRDKAGIALGVGRRPAA